MCVPMQRKKIKLRENFGDPPYTITAQRRSFQKAKVLTFGNTWKAPLHMMFNGDISTILKHQYIFHITLTIDRRGRKGKMCSDFSSISSFPPTGRTQARPSIKARSRKMTALHSLTPIKYVIHLKICFIGESLHYQMLLYCLRVTNM